MRQIRTSGSMSGRWKRGTARRVRHRQPKGPVTDGLCLIHRATSRLYYCLRYQAGVHGIGPRLTQVHSRHVRPIGLGSLSRQRRVAPRGLVDERVSFCAMSEVRLLPSKLGLAVRLLQHCRPDGAASNKYTDP